MPLQLDYPRQLHKAGGLTLTVSNDADRDAALAAGWSLTPITGQPAVPAHTVLFSIPNNPVSDVSMRLEVRRAPNPVTGRVTRSVVLVDTTAGDPADREFILATREDIGT